MKKILTMICFVLLTVSMTSNKPPSQADDMYNYDHCFGEAAASEAAALYFGQSFSDAYNYGNQAFDKCVDRVDLHAEMYWSVH